MMRNSLRIVLGIAAVAICTMTTSAVELLENNDLELESRFTPHGTPGVDHPNGYPDYWHHSTNSAWSNGTTDPSTSPSHSLYIPDDNNGGLANGREEMRSFATSIAGVGIEGRTLDLSWNWQWDITAGDKFSAIVRISDAPAVSLDLVGANIVDHVFFTDGATNSNGFQTFSASIPLASTDASFDIIFRTTEDVDGAQAESGVLFIDDVSATTIPEPASLLLLSTFGLGLLAMARRHRG